MILLIPGSYILSHLTDQKYVDVYTAVTSHNVQVDKVEGIFGDIGTVREIVLPRQREGGMR